MLVAGAGGAAATAVASTTTVNTIKKTTAASTPKRLWCWQHQQVPRVRGLMPPRLFRIRVMGVGGMLLLAPSAGMPPLITPPLIIPPLKWSGAAVNNQADSTGVDASFDGTPAYF